MDPNYDIVPTCMTISEARAELELELVARKMRPAKTIRRSAVTWEVEGGEGGAPW